MEKKPDTAAFIKKNLKTRFVGRELQYLEVTTSTQDAAREMAEQGSPDGAAAMAGIQKAGRGRLGRSWFSPEGGLAVSIILKPRLDDLYLLPAISAVAVYRALQRLGIDGGIKWPNDILVKGRKICGILIENCLDGGRLKYSAVGIGINVNFDTAGCPEIAGISTSLSNELGRNVPIGAVAVHLFTELEQLYLQISDAPYIIGEWMCHMETIGRRISISAGGSILQGTARSINCAGNLIMALDDGTLKEIIAGDVTILKK